MSPEKEKLEREEWRKQWEANSIKSDRWYEARKEFNKPEKTREEDEEELRFGGPT